MALAAVVGSAAHAMAVTFAMIASGMLLRASGVVSPAGQREMSQVAVKLLLPAFNFSALIADVSWERLQACRGVALFAVLHVAIGLSLGMLLCRMGKSSPFLRQHRGQVMVLCAFCNGTAMPLTLFRALVSSTPELKEVEAAGALDITIYGTVWRLLLWTVGIALLEADGAPEAVGGDSPSKARRGPGPSPGALLRAALLNTNTAAALGGFLVALGPASLRSVFFGGPLAFLREAIANVSKASHPMLLLTLGAALWPAPSCSDWQAVGGICAVKLIGLPIVTFVLLQGGLAAALNLSVTGALAVAIEACVPSALQISMMVQSTGRDARTCTVVCFWQHIAALLTMTAALAVALAGMP
eukprot:CAMPEP_0203969528 /NCGR_PEP_ID=MMETSP0359-20131031/97502_1 /ASSEMBLY_ACC=CAM_ASM_000338 /TAXON_ID=268821 /ORGANISM="Scrippsiella Hangoei, Strain SHTV-5" /LENGTH=356 /DNA_ID=CAMNT_0050907469 /DNA_START=68 /DNA_END=1138 /DNA_ORIENTATION=+